MSSMWSAMNPNQLVDDFKKSGEFDRLRRDLLNQFRTSEGMAMLSSRVEEIIKHKLASDHKLQYMTEGLAFRDLMQELERYPLIERAITDIPVFSDVSFISSIRHSLSSLLREEQLCDTRGGSSSATTPPYLLLQADAHSIAMDKVHEVTIPDILTSMSQSGVLNAPPTRGFKGDTQASTPRAPCGESPEMTTASLSPVENGSHPAVNPI